jgi:peptidoglycan hydrolase-like protein with peptidoglycan-binding domain
VSIKVAAAGFSGLLAGMAIALPLAGIAAPSPSRGSVQETARHLGQPTPALLALSPASVRVVKQALNRLGYSAGHVTGVPDAQLSSALVSFEEAHGLEPTGTITVSAIAALGLWDRIIGDPLGNGRNAVETLGDLYGPSAGSATASDQSATTGAARLPSQRVTNEVPGGGDLKRSDGGAAAP